MYRRRAIVETGLRYCLRHWARLGAVCEGGRIWSTWYVCMNVGARTWARTGGCARCCWAGWFAVMAQDCVGVVDLSVAGVQWCIQTGGLQSCRDDYEQVCALEHTECTQVLGGTDGETDGLLSSMWGTRTSEGTGGSKHRRLQMDQGMLGVWSLRQIKGRAAWTLRGFT